MEQETRVPSGGTVESAGDAESVLAGAWEEERRVAAVPTFNKQTRQWTPNTPKREKYSAMLTKCNKGCEEELKDTEAAIQRRWGRGAKIDENARKLRVKQQMLSRGKNPSDEEVSESIRKADAEVLRRLRRQCKKNCFKEAKKPMAYGARMAPNLALAAVLGVNEEEAFDLLNRAAAGEEDARARIAAVIELPALGGWGAGVGGGKSKSKKYRKHKTRRHNKSKKKKSKTRRKMKQSNKRRRRRTASKGRK